MMARADKEIGSTRHKAHAGRGSARRGRGITIIEFVVVIIVIGILAAVSLPLYVNLARQARVSKLQAAYGAVYSGAALANNASHAKRLGPSDPVQMEVYLVTMSAHFPTADFQGIIIASGLDPNEYQFAPAGANTVLIVVPGGGAPASCSFTYTHPIVVGDPPLIGNFLTGGC